MADDQTPTQTPAAPPAEPAEGVLHSLATSVGIDPEAVKSAWRTIKADPVQAAKEIGGAQVDEFVEAAKHPVGAAMLALHGVVNSITNPEAQAQAKARLHSPGIMNKLIGAQEYLTSGIPFVGGGYAKAEEQGARGNLPGAIGTIVGTTAPILAGEAARVPEAIHEAGAEARASMAARHEARIAEAKTGDVITVRPDEQTLPPAPAEAAPEAKAAAAPEAKVAPEGGVVPTHIDFSKIGGIERRGPTTFGRGQGSFPDTVNTTFQIMRELETPTGTAPEAPEIRTEGPTWDRMHSAYVGDEKVGSVGYKLDPEGEAKIYGSQVKPELRGKGIGQKLYRSAIEEARNAGATRIMSDPTHLSPDAARVWERLQGRGLPVESITHPTGEPGYQIDFEKQAEPPAATPEPQFEQTLARRGQLPNQKVNLSDAYGATGKYVGGLVDYRPPADMPAASPLEAANKLHGVTHGPELLPIPEHLMTPGGTSHDTITHELAHGVVADLVGLPTEGAEVYSHLHPVATARGSAATIDLPYHKIPGTRQDFLSGDVHFPRPVLEATWPKFIPTYLAGGVAQELVHGIPFEKNEGMYGDLEGLHHIGKMMGFTRAETQDMINAGIQQTRDLLNHPETLEILRKSAGEREEGLPRTLHASADKVQDVIRQVREARHEPIITEAGAEHGAVPAEAEPRAAGAGAEKDVREDYGQGISPRAEARKVGAEYHPDLQKLADQFGVDSDAEKIRNGASFIAPDGKFIHLSGGATHDAAIDWATGRGVTKEAPDNRVAFLRDTGAVRTRFTTGKAGNQLAVSVPKAGITPEQVNALKQAVGQGLGRNGNLTMEIGEPSGAAAGPKEFATPKDVEPMLKQIGAHPEQAVTPKLDARKRAAIQNNVTPIEHTTANDLMFEQGKKDWAARAAESVKTGGFTIHPETGHIPEEGHVIEVAPEQRKALPATPTKEDIEQFHAERKPLFQQHPELHVGGYGNELNVSAVGTPEGAKLVGNKLDQEAGWDAKNKELVPYEGKGKQTSFPGYPLEQRLKELGTPEGGTISPILEARKAPEEPTLPLSQFKIIGGKEEEFQQAVKNSPFAGISKRGLTVNLTRFQKPEQKGEQAGRGGVFYLGGEGGAGYYARKTVGGMPVPYGGPEEMRGRTTFQNPLIVKGGFGGHMQEKAIDALSGGAKTLRGLFIAAHTAAQFKAGDEQVQAIADVLKQYGGNPQSAYDIWAGSRSTQQIAAAVYDHVVGQMAKDAGHDAIIGYYKKPGGGYRISEVFDLTAETFPEKSEPKGATTVLQKHPLVIEGTGPGGRTTVVDLASALNEWSQAGLKPKKEISVALDRARAELQYQLAQDNSGLNWYKSDVKDAIGHLQANGFPELKDPVQDKLFRVLWGVTSYGVDPDVNLTSAAEAWKQYKETGKIPLKADAKTNWPGYSGIKGSITLLNKLIDEKGEQGAVDWLLSKHPVSEIREQKLKTHEVHGVAGKAGEEKYGAFIFGPKGGPYTLSLQGITDHTTVDVWGARMIRRWTGTLTPESMIQPVTPGEARKFHQVVENVGKEFGLDTSDVQAVLWGYEHDLYEAHGAGEAAKSYKGAAEKYVTRQKEGNTRDFIREQSGLFAEKYARPMEQAQGGRESAPAGGPAESRTEGLMEGLSRLGKPAEPSEAAEPEEGDTSFQFGANVLKGLEKPGSAAKKPIPTKLKQTKTVADNMNDPDTRFNAARHEAAHAVISEALNPGSVNMTGLTAGGGVTDIQPPAGKQTVGQLSPDEVRNMIATSYAGGLSEQGGTTARHASGDVAARAQVLAGRGTAAFGQAPELQAEARARVNALLADPAVQQHINTLTTHITTKGKLSGDEVRAILKGQTQSLTPVR